MDHDVRVRLLGKFEVEGLAEHEIGTRKARTVLKALALARGLPVPTGRLIDATWGEEAPADPAAQIAVLISRLRRVLGAERLTRTDDGYTFTPDWLDVVELERRADEAAQRLASGAPAAARAAARAALDLARGPLIPDEEGEWVDIERAAIDRTVARVRLVAAEGALAAADASDAAAAAESALDHDPYDEAALRLLMRAHVGAGRPASALAAYARTRHRLAEDLGVDPAPETETLHTGILLGTEDAAPSAPTGPPRPAAGDLVGRSSALAALDAAFESVGGGGAGAAVVHGEAGIGKTTLVSHWAAHARSRGAVILSSRCDELGRDLPLQPILDALHGHLAAVGSEAAAELLAGDAAPVAALLGRAATADQPAAPMDLLHDSEARRTVLYAALLEVVRRIAAGSAAAIIVEDLHLASPGTIEWLRLAARRGHRLLVLATTRPDAHATALEGARVIELGPLDLDATTQLVGEDRAHALYERSGGHPLFLLELANASDDALPASIRDAVSARANALGEGANVLRAAAILGQTIDLDVLSTVTQCPAVEVLDHLEAAVRARLMEERGATFAFRHELMREALESATTASRRALVHRDAARALLGRPYADPLDVAWHARLGGDAELASTYLVAAGDIAANRFDLEDAERLFSEAVTVHDTPAARLARARIRLARWNPDGARRDVEDAISAGAGTEALELGGWIAYYARDFDAARAYADEGIARARDSAVRSSCLALAGRIRHSAGELVGGSALLEDAVDVAPADRRGVPLIWLGQVRMHQGRLDEASALLARALVEPEALGHPFALLHALYGLAYARGAAGRVELALQTVDQLREVLDRRGDERHRFFGVAGNLRGWLLRNVGESAAADDENAVAVAMPPSPATAEPRYVGVLDLVDGRLAVADIDGATALLDGIADIVTWDGVMAWRQRNRYDFYRARIALAGDKPEQAMELAASVAHDAEARNSPRYVLFARLLEARAAAATGMPVDHDRVDAELARLDEVAALEAWWWTAEMAAALGVDRWWQNAERRVEKLAAAAGERAAGLRVAARARFDQLKSGR